MLVSLPAWGRHTDKAGCVQVIRLTSILLPVIPMLWLVSANKIYLGVIQAFSGFAWGGSTWRSRILFMTRSPEEKRVRCVSYYNLINGFGPFCGRCAWRSDSFRLAAHIRKQPFNYFSALRHFKADFQDILHTQNTGSKTRMPPVKPGPVFQRYRHQADDGHSEDGLILKP